MEVEKLIFLDIDGVLNHRMYYEEKSQDKRYKEVGWPMCDISERSVDILNDLINKTGAKVVISSTWRKSRSQFHIAHLLGNAGFIGEVIGCTPRLTAQCSKAVPRGFEIEVWLSDNRRGKNIKYIILDDDSDMLLHQADNYIQVDGYCGITPNVAYRAARKLNAPV